MRVFKNITKTVWVLSFVSLFTDMASEMLYPVMPVYLKSIGFSIVLIGVLEGFAEAVTGLSKGYFGKLSDVTGNRMAFVRLGYFMSTISKPMLALFIHPLWVFFSRTIDRFGKGIRTGARDAILSAESKPETKASVFGLHRAMDTFGAVIGPASALIYLTYFPNDYKTLFIIAFFPGLMAVAFSFLAKENKTKEMKEKKQVNFLASFKYWKESPNSYKRLTTGLLIFTLFNSSDVFLLLKIKESGLADTDVISVYIFYNLVYALFSFPIGILADKIGLRKILIFGLVLFSFVYGGMAITTHLYGYIFLFFIYGIYAASTEGISKALISNIVDNKDTGAAIGTYSGFQSICTLLASIFAGLIWHNFGAPITFIISASAAIFVVLYFLMKGIGSRIN